MNFINFVTVRNMLTPGGNVCPNHHILIDPHGEMMVSYGTKICFVTKDSFKCNDGVKRQHIILDENYWNYSRTTSKYRTEFLGMNTQDLKRLEKLGAVQYDNLNKRSYGR